MKNDKISKESKNLVIENVEQIKKMFPEVVSEGKINFEKLKLILGQELDDKEDSYTFNWAGRKDTFRSIQTTAKGTLVPDEKESINFKRTENIFIEGDNLEVLKLLQKSYSNQVKMIYIDPPYNTGHDFVYKDNFKNGIKAYLEQTGQLNGDGVVLTTNPETSGRFHSDWISMMYSRLFLAKNLMREDGVIFVSIDDHEVHNLKRIMNEIFGEENALDRGSIIWVNKGSTKGFNKIVKNHEYILAYAKDAEKVKSVFGDNFPEELKEIEHYCFNAPNPGNPACDIKFKAGCKIIGIKDKVFKDSVGDEVKLKIISGEMIFKDGILLRDVVLRGSFPYRNQIEEFFNNKEYGLPTLDYKGQEWQEIFFNSNGLPKYRKSRNTLIISSVLDLVEIPNYGSDDIKELFGRKEIFPFPKPKELILYLSKYFIKSGDIIMDFFAGSGTTGHSTILLNTMIKDGNIKYILIQLPELTDKNSEAYKEGYKTIADIAKERIRRVIKKLEKEEKTKLMKKNIDLGFKVFKLEKSNYQIWENYEGQDIKELTKQLDLFKSPLVNGYDDYNVIYECIIKEGLNLNAKIEKIDVSGNTIYKVSDENHSFHICLDEKIRQENLNKLDLKKDDLLICLDSSLDDSKKVNISMQCKLETL